MLEAPAGQALFGRILQPATAEPDTWRKTRANFAPRTAIENGVGVLEIHGVLASWIASQSKAVISARSAIVGSIGAYVSGGDYHRMLGNAGMEVRVFTNKESAFKAAGMPGAETTGDHTAEFTRQAQRSFDGFRADVLRARPNVHEDALQGQVFDGQQAKRNGLEEALGGLGYAKAVARKLTRGFERSRKRGGQQLCPRPRTPSLTRTTSWPRANA